MSTKERPTPEFIELLKRWLRISAGNSDLEEQKARLSCEELRFTV